jgi:hypothetical protein
MFTMLDVLLGVTFIYLLLSLICTAAVEALEIVLKKRAASLKEAIARLLGDKTCEDLYSHALIQALYKKGGRLPSYIPTRTFVVALMEGVLRRGVRGSVADLEQKVQALPAGSEPLKDALQALLAAADGDLARLQVGVADWFNAAMDRVSGWYKRRSQIIVFCIGLVIAAAYNIDTIQVVNQLSRDSALRAALVSAAEARQRTGPGEAGFQQEVKVLGDLGLPLGWSFEPAGGGPLTDLRRPPSSVVDWVLKVLGLLLTGLAVSLGAPFWFDVLNKIVVVRSTVKPTEKSPEEPSKD